MVVVDALPAKPNTPNQGALSLSMSLPRSLSQVMLSLDILLWRRTSAVMKGRMFRRTPSFRSGFQPMGCSARRFKRTKMSCGGSSSKNSSKRRLSRIADRDLVGLGHHRFVPTARAALRWHEPREVAACHLWACGNVRCVQGCGKTMNTCVFHAMAYTC